MSTTAQFYEDRLASAIGQGRACHAFFLSGQDGAQTCAMARRTAALVCTGAGDAAALEMCPDYFELVGREADVEGIRSIMRELTHRPTGRFGRAIVIRDAHMLSEQIENILLKTIEEPPAGTVFILTGNAEGVLPTVASRCCVLHMGQTGVPEVKKSLLAHGAAEGEASLYAAVSGGSLARAEKLFLDPGARELRSASLAAFVRLLSGGLPVTEAKTLAKNAGEALTYMLSFASDMLRLLCGFDVAENVDMRAEAAQAVQNFTIGKLTCIIDMLASCNAQIVRGNRGWYYAVPAMNRLFLDISEVIDK